MSTLLPAAEPEMSSIGRSGFHTPWALAAAGAAASANASDHGMTDRSRVRRLDLFDTVYSSAIVAMRLAAR
jgi:hypothetical protein